MNVTVFGATGGVGGQIVRQALDAGHQVTAVVREKARLPLVDPGLRIVTADVTDGWSLVPHLTGRDAVLSGLGPHGRRSPGIAGAATAAIVQAMGAAEVRRIVVISAAPLFPVPEHDALLLRYLATPMIRRVLKGVYADLADMEATLAASDLEWTSFRPPQLKDAPLTGGYRRTVGAAVPKGWSISRADVAHAMLAALDDPATVKQPVGIAY
ncbi:MULTISPECIES: NAD(P)-dependent oxidoreductase [Streptacidiphilus]|uniref:NAD(P)-dependent oxidoreductase n=1 Tax=Streptacidiphilus cavernicola TaxID=3342716 RepID=A0ABV6UES5_9ACTN|nr:NAD(P)H-binding protein [Streptacidiphilus jeojiense]